MLIRTDTVAALMFLVAPGVAIAADTSPTEAPSTPAAKPKERKICTRESGTGSIVPKLVCRTATEAKEDNARSLQDLDQMKTSTQHGGSRN